MGYRNYIGRLDKKEHLKIKDYSLEELYTHKGLKYEDYPDDVYIGVYDVSQEVIFEFGNYCNEPPKECMSPVFTNKDTQEYFNEDHEFYIVDKEFIKWKIEEYNKTVVSLYEKLIPDLEKSIDPIPDEETISKWYCHLRSMSIEWRMLTPFNLDEGDEVTTSWKFEYLIFELVRIYKTFDWENNIMIYYGY